MITIESQALRVRINPVGAEYDSIVRLDTGLEYLWQGDPAWWDRKSPILFPFLGVSRGGQYTYAGKTYPMGGHGFAKDMAFETVEQKPDAVRLRLCSNAETRAVYPFDFELFVTYTVQDITLYCEYEVVNRTAGDLYFSIGAHPGINLPLLPGESWADYDIVFERKETADTWCFRNGGVQWQTEPCLEDTDTLPITPHMFDEDALIFKGLKSRFVSFAGRTNGHRVTMDFHRFPTLAFWSAGPNAPYICMEPWCGHADMIDHDGELTHKVDVERLLEGETFRVGYTLKLD